MNSKPIAFVAVVALAALPAAVQAGTTAAKSGPDSVFGEANRQTMMAQIIDPDPQYTKPMTTDADHAAKAVEHYREGQVKTPDKVRTSSTVGGG